MWNTNSIYASISLRKTQPEQFCKEKRKTKKKLKTSHDMKQIYIQYVSHTGGNPIPILYMSGQELVPALYIRVAGITGREGRTLTVGLRFKTTLGFLGTSLGFFQTFLGFFTTLTILLDLFTTKGTSFYEQRSTQYLLSF